MLYQYHFDAYPNNFYSAIPGNDAEVVFGTFQWERKCRSFHAHTLALSLPSSGSLPHLAQAMDLLLGVPMAAFIFIHTMIQWFVVGLSQCLLKGSCYLTVAICVSYSG